MSRLFVSASFPVGDRARAVEPYDARQIADVVAHVARAVLRERHIVVFGAHPTISPVVLAVAGELDARGAVEIHQSRWFEDEIPSETRRLVDMGYGHIVWTEAERARKSSLTAMRRRMLFDRPPAAAVFAGGMDGIFEEQELAAEAGARCFAFAGPGGAARLLGDRPGVELLEGPRYPALATRVVDALGAE